MFYIVDPVFDAKAQELHKALTQFFTKYPHLKPGSMERLYWSWQRTTYEMGKKLIGSLRRGVKAMDRLSTAMAELEQTMEDVSDIDS